MSHPLFTVMMDFRKGADSGVRPYELHHRPSRTELNGVWKRVFHQHPPAEMNLTQMKRVIEAATSPLRLDFEINRQRGFAFDHGETPKCDP